VIFSLHSTVGECGSTGSPAPRGRRAISSEEAPGDRPLTMRKSSNKIMAILFPGGFFEGWVVRNGLAARIPAAVRVDPVVRGRGTPFACAGGERRSQPKARRSGRSPGPCACLHGRTSGEARFGRAGAGSRRPRSRDSPPHVPPPPALNLSTPGVSRRARRSGPAPDSPNGLFRRTSFEKVPDRFSPPARSTFR